MNPIAPPDCPIDTRSFDEWADHYREELLGWYRVTQGAGHEDYDVYLNLMWWDQVKHEDELVMGQAW